MGGLVLDAVLAVAVLGVAVAVLRLRDAYGATLAFIAFGLLLAVVWVRLGAPDIALTEAAIGGGVTGVMLIGAAARLRDAVVPAPAGLPLRLVAGVLCASVTLGLAAAVLLLPDPAPSLAPAVMANLHSTGLGNPVAGVLMSFRALDTLLESVVLVFALIAVWSLAPDAAWGGRPGPVHAPQLHGPLSLLARLLPPIGIVIGVHITLVGADAPGGKFQGGTILAAMWILPWMAGLVRPPPISRVWLRLGIIAGPLVFVAVGLLGTLVADGFLAYPDGVAKPLILLIEVAMTLSVAITLCLLVAGPPEASP